MLLRPAPPPPPFPFGSEELFQFSIGFGEKTLDSLVVRRYTVEKL